MPFALTPRQSEYLEFLRQYIQENESSPGLAEIADRFGVTSPTAHKTLESLQSKGYLYFGLDSVSGFFIRLIDRAGSAETVIEIPIAGKVNKYGEVYDFPQELGHFATLLIGSEPGEVFALVVMEDIPQASIMAQDLLICDYGKRPQPGNICIIPFGMKAERLFLCQMYSLTFDKDTPQMVVANPYPIPENLLNKDLGQKLNWTPLTYDEDSEEYFLDLTQEEDVPAGPIPPELVVATVLRLSRALAF
jgi:SOS-response transcriptional repressor LexA